MKLLFPSNISTAATTAAVIVLLAVFTFGYNTGGGGFMFGRPIFITPNTIGRCVSPPFSSSFSSSSNCQVDKAFENLESEMNADKDNNGFSAAGSFRRGGSGFRRGGDFGRRGPGANKDVNIDQETVEALRQQRAQQQELFNQALDLTNDVVNGIRSSEDDNATTLREKQKAWFNRAFDMIAPDVAASPERRGRSSAAFFSPRFEIINNAGKFQILVDVPGVKPSNIDIRLVDNGDNDEKRSNGNTKDKVLIIHGQRESRIDDNAPPVEFKKEFFVDASVIDIDSIAAQIDNGVLVVTATKRPPPAKREPVQKKIPVTQVGSDNDNGQTATVSVVMKDESSAVEDNNKKEDVDDDSSSSQE
jgi:HSP20 family molecular chaperone IbpA